MSLQGSELDRTMKGAGRLGLESSGSDLSRKFWTALVLYGILGLLVWFTMGEGKVLVHGRPVELRLIPLIVIGGLALRTVVAHQAQRIRSEDSSRDGKGSTG